MDKKERSYSSILKYFSQVDSQSDMEIFQFKSGKLRAWVSVPNNSDEVIVFKVDTINDANSLSPDPALPRQSPAGAS